MSKLQEYPNISSVNMDDKVLIVRNNDQGLAKLSDLPIKTDIPDELKNGMNSVLNKKLGTDTTYSPDTWPNNVNLLGKLQEKTETGNIVHIEDGADGVPIKSWEVTLPASLTGYSSIVGTKSGKNFYSIKIGADRFSNNSGATHTNNDGTLIINAAANNNSGVYINTNDTLCEIRNTLKWFNDNSYPRIISLDVICSVDNATLAITSGTRYTFTMGTTKTRVSLVSTGANCSMYVQGADLGQSCTFEISNFQIEYGTTATAYSAYEAPTQYTASLGRTIYGGQADIVTGKGSEEYARVDLGSLTWTKVTSGQAPYFASSALNPAYKYVNNNPNAICSDYTQASIGSTGTANGFFITDGSSIRIRDDNHSSETGTEFKTSMSGKYLTYELATPTDFTFTPITPTPETENVCNFWADNGNSSIVYRCEETIDPSPSTGTANLLFYLDCVGDDEQEIPQVNSLYLEDEFNEYLTFDASTRKFTVIKNFSAHIIAYVFQYRSPRASYSYGQFVVNDIPIKSYHTETLDAKDMAGEEFDYQFSVGDLFWVYTPNTDGYPQQRLNVYVNVHSGTTLISKTVTQNGTYNASDDEADGYSDVTVNIDSPTPPVIDSKTVTQNGTYNASDDELDGYSSVTVTVPSPEMNSKTITENGTYNPEDDNLDGYSSVTVNVPIATLGTKTVTQNGTYNASDDNSDGYSSVVVSVNPVDMDSKVITENGVYLPSSDNLDGYSAVNVQVPPPVLVSKSITENGTYDPEDDNADGYSEVTVNIPVMADLMNLMANADSSNRLVVSDAVIKTNATKVPAYIFYGTYLELVNLQNIEEVGEYAFYSAHLSQIILPKCKTIGIRAFYKFNEYWAGGIEDWNLDKVETIGANAFYGSKIAGVLDLPECKSMGEAAFSSCSYLTGVNLPKCETIGKEALRGTSISTDIELPAVKTIGQQAFQTCTSVNFTIGENCTSIGSAIFNTSGVTNLYVLATTPPTLSGKFTNTSGQTGVEHIYVPSGSVAAYQAANNWSQYSSLIESIPT